ncbi:MAG: phosphoribosylaminoimidazolesuccinocarboxamide synthase, partial [Candidatus Omnitrophica bacterium]|nr:phosphoribosylaminoimidazolesuccinocarboxamide synthase [Candidatus Omnitrophota bacterium]
IAKDKELDTIKKSSFMVNEALKAFFNSKGLTLVDFKLEFGRNKNKIILADEISPDTCRLWDKETNEKLDKDRFRRDLGGVEEAYQEVLRRVLE